MIDTLRKKIFVKETTARDCIYLYNQHLKLSYGIGQFVFFYRVDVLSVDGSTERKT